MRLKRINIDIMKFLVIALYIYLIVAGSLDIFALIYIFTSLILGVQLCMSKNDWQNKVLVSFIYLTILTAQLMLSEIVIFSGEQAGFIFEFTKFVAALLTIVPFFTLYMNSLYTSQKRFFPAIQDASAVSIKMVKDAYFQAGELKDTIVRSKESLNMENLTEVAKDIPRHSYTRYLNRDTLTEAFFRDCEASLEDENLYLVISSTGSSGSELLSVFTRKEYNHVSISFDRDLKTILSYNGGGNVYPPGLNKEQLEFFQQKDDASMMVYRLKASREKKTIALDKIREINQNGSAYNLIGLVTKVSIRPNIMFCSQFVYSLLTVAGLEYFNEKAAKVKPTDFVEKDYYRKLKFCYEIKFKQAKLS